jgi:hypothetical protein
MKKLFFGLAFLGSVLLINRNAKAQETEPGEGGSGSQCYQRMYWCGGRVEAYNCETYQTGTSCSRY